MEVHPGYKIRKAYRFSVQRYLACFIVRGKIRKGTTLVSQWGILYSLTLSYLTLYNKGYLLFCKLDYWPKGTHVIKGNILLWTPCLLFTWPSEHRSPCQSLTVAPLRVEPLGSRRALWPTLQKPGHWIENQYSKIPKIILRKILHTSCLSVSVKIESNLTRE